MRRSLLLLLAATAAASALVMARRGGRDATPTAAVEKGPFERWTVHAGRLGARRETPVLSAFHGAAVVVELAPEGTAAREGDVVARFDTAELERERAQLEHDLARAEAERDALVQAALPLAERRLAAQALEARAAWEAERRFLAEARELADDDLVSPQELTALEERVAGLARRMGDLEEERRLTREHLHPAERAKAEGAVAAARRRMDTVREQMERCVVRAPADGLVVYRPLPFGAERRPVRIGDTLFRNQPFMVLPDLRELVVLCEVPEAALADVQEDRPCAVVPRAFPGVRLTGRIERVGFLGRALSGDVDEGRLFRVHVAVDGSDPRLRPEMTVDVHVRAHRREDAVLVPRAAVAWEAGAPRCRVLAGGRTEEREPVLGRANLTHFEVLDGLQPGERVVLP